MVSQPLWHPTDDQIKSTRMTQFIQEVQKKEVKINTYKDLYSWSIRNVEDFWSLVWDFCGVVGEKGDQILIPDKIFHKNKFFPNAKLNYAENLLYFSQSSNAQSDAIVFWGEDRFKSRLSHQDLYNQVEKLTSALRKMGVQKGDRVAALLPNLPAAIIAMLATAAIGAIWSSCSPDFGSQGVLDRFTQIEPKVFFTVDGYFYNGKIIDCYDKIIDIAAQLPSVQKVVLVGYILGKQKTFPENFTYYDEFISDPDPITLRFEKFPFNHPLFILFSSGTTGKPKCILHGAGGTLIQHLKEHQLHTNIKAGDRVFYFTTCGWMMWNWLASALASNATLLLYDGSPFATDTILFDYAEVEGMTVLGTSAKYIDSLRKKKIIPKQTHSLASLEIITSTGSPLAPEGFEYIYKHIKQDICLASISGGTDIISCFALGNPIAPVYSGELQTVGLGLAVEVFNEAGESISNEKGELVCTKPFPSMPLCL